jgi:tetratricopeptide (TPR) repeat protein
MFIVLISSDISARPEKPDAVKDETYLLNDSSETVTLPPASDSQNEIHLIDAGDKQVRMIQARILSRQGLYVKSLNIYKSLLEDFPDDEAIWINYIDSLVNFSDYDLALVKINKLLENNPSNIEAKKIKARIYYEQGKYKWSYDIYESILKQNRLERGVWSDYAFAKLNAGDWTDALNYFSMILEHDYENKTALQSIYEIQKAHRPRLEMGYRSYTQSEDDVINTSSSIYTRHITNDTLFSVDYDRITVDRPSDPEFGINSLDLTIDDTKFRLRHQFNEQWEAEIGGGFYFGLDGGFTFLTGLDYKILENGWLRADYFLNRPWYDPLEAANLDGSFNEVDLSFDWSFSKVWGLFLGVEQLDYFIDGSKDYGEERSFTGILTRRFETAKSIPDFYLSYSFQRSKFDYEKKDFRPVPMVESEQRHAISFNLEHWLSKRWAITLAGSVSKDLDRELNAFGYSPGVKFKIGKRFEFVFNYDFSSESSNVGGGETEAFTFLLKSRL